MDFNKYQDEARKTAFYPNINHNIQYPALGLAGETGEVCEKIKKIIRDNDGIVTGVKRDEIKKELGDCLWYIANLASELEIKLSDVAETNISKLNDRKKRNVLKGDGDNR